LTAIPRSALLLGLAGLIPFVWGAVSQLVPQLGEWGMHALGPRFIGPYISLGYGTIILAFMSGVLWGFATRASGAEAASGYALSTVPALWAFLFVGGGPVSAAIYLAAGFVALLALDRMFWQQGLAPEWWMRLRLILTAVTLGCLAVPVFL
jgi:hypothetical protein